MTRDQRHLSWFYFVYFSSAAALIPNLPLIFEDAGFSGSEIGWLLSLSPAIAVVAAPAWGGLADASGHRRVLLSIGLIGAAATALALGTTTAYVPTVVVMAVFSLAVAPIVPFADAASIEAIEEGGRYGRLRLWGGVGWGVAAPIAGWGIDRVGLGLASILFAAGMMSLLIILRRMAVDASPSRTPIGIGMAFAHTKGWAPLLGGAFVVGITGGTVGYLFLFLRSLGASGVTMGLALAIATVSELIAFSQADRVISRLGIARTMLIGAGLGVVRLLIYGLLPSVGWALAAQLLHGGTFALPWAAGVIGASRLSRDGMGTVSQGLLTAVFVGLGPTVGLIAAGYLLDRGTAQSMMAGIAIVVLFGTALMAVPLLRTQDL